MNWEDVNNIYSDKYMKIIYNQVINIQNLINRNKSMIFFLID